MTLPALTDPRWRRALTGAEPKVTSLATRLLLARLRDDVRHNPGTLAEAAAQLHAFFSVNAFATRDLMAL